MRATNTRIRRRDRCSSIWARKRGGKRGQLVPAKVIQHLGTGRRKTATARVSLRPGKGQITVNHRPFEDYFASESARAYVRQPLLATETADRFDVIVLAHGGGITGQSGA